MTVAVVMGSDSDLPTMRPAVETLGRLDIPVEVGVVSAHRTPHDMLDFGRSARERGIDVIIAGAGGAAHLPGMLASVTTLPVIGVPVAGGTVGGIDALFSIAQMPRGVPVATMAIGGAENAALLAARILGVSEPEIADRLDAHAAAQAERAREGDAVVRADT